MIAKAIHDYSRQFTTIHDNSLQNASRRFKDSGSTYVGTQEECNALGVGEIFLEETLVFPNPAKNILHIELPKDSFGNILSPNKYRLVLIRQASY